MASKPSRLTSSRLRLKKWNSRRSRDFSKLKRRPSQFLGRHFIKALHVFYWLDDNQNIPGRDRRSFSSS
jgi:hypothetical protein